MPGGRPPTYKPEFVKQAKKLAKLGATDMELADFFEVTVRTINAWKISHLEFSQSLKAGKEEADARVERSLFQRATGYEVESVKILQDKGEPVYAPYREHVQPDTTACIFWLKNRKPAEWRDRQSLDVTGELSLAECINRARKRDS